MSSHPSTWRKAYELKYVWQRTSKKLGSSSPKKKEKKKRFYLQKGFPCIISFLIICKEVNKKKNDRNDKKIVYIFLILYWNYNLNQGRKMRTRWQEKYIDLHYELPSVGGSLRLVVLIPEMCRIENVSYELLQVMHCTMDL